MPVTWSPVTIVGVSSSTGPAPFPPAAAHEPADSALPPLPMAPDPQLVGRVRRILDGVGTERTDADPARRALSAALARHDAPPDLRIRGPVGSGRHSLARTLHSRRGWRFAVDDIDRVAAAADPPSTPDVEVLLLCTAPCAHELRWIDRPRIHPMLVVVTAEPSGPVPADPSGAGSASARRDRPPWVRGRLSVDVEDADHPGTDRLIHQLLRAMASVPALRAHRLATELEVMAADPDLGDVAESALCGHLTAGPA